MLYLLFWIVVVGVISYFVETQVPMQPFFKALFRLVLILIVIYILYQLAVNYAPPMPRR
jgi:heme A synthase